MKFITADRKVRAAFDAFNRHINIKLYPPDRHEEVRSKSNAEYNSLVKELASSRKRLKKKKANKLIGDYFEAVHNFAFKGSFDGPDQEELLRRTNKLGSKLFKALTKKEK